MIIFGVLVGSECSFSHANLSFPATRDRRLLRRLVALGVVVVSARRGLGRYFEGVSSEIF